MRLKALRKTVSLIASFSLLFNSLLAPVSVLAQEVTPTPTPVETSSPSPDPTVTPTDVPTTSPLVTPTTTPEVTLSPSSTPTLSSSVTPVVTPTPSPEPTVLSEATTSPVPEPTSSPTVTTDKSDYHPGEVATITGQFFQAVTNLVLKVFGGSEADGTYKEESFNVTTNEVGTFAFQYLLDSVFRPLYTVQIFDLLGSKLAETTFTDSPPLSLDTAQCRNGTVSTPNGCLDLGGGSGWVSGNANATQSHFKEGDTIPYRAVINNPTSGTTYAVSVLWDTRKNGVNATDYLAYARTIPEAVDPCDGAGTSVANCALPPLNSGSYPAGVTAYDMYSLIGPGGSSTALNCTGLKTGTIGEISATPGCTSYTNLRTGSAGGTRGGEVVVVGGTLQDIRLPRQDALSTNPADSETTSSRAVFYVTASSTSNIVIAFGGHIAARSDWGSLGGIPQSAGGISGSPYHLSKEGLCEAVTSPTDCTTGAGQGDLQLAAAAVIAPSTITVHKVTNPSSDTTTNFPFTTSGTGYSGFSLVGGGSNSQSVAPGSYSVTETDPAPSYSNTALTCTATGTGTSATPNLGTRSVAVTIGSGGGGVVDCTYTNTLQQAHLTLVKTVTNDNGGTAAVADWTLSASGPTSISGTSGSGAVTNAAVNQGSYTLSESGGPSNYTASTYSCVRNGGGAVVSNSITLAPNDNATCTINNNDNAPQLHLRKTVTNDNGGSALATAWTLAATGTGGSPTNLSGTTPVDSGATFKADTYALAESGGPSGYTAGAWNCGGATMPDATHVTVPLGGNVTCTINNNDQAGQLKIIKNTVGGDATFNFTVTGPTASTPSILTSSGTGNTGFLAVNAGGYSVSETPPSGWDLTSSSCDSGTPGSFTVQNGGSVTCTFTNTKRGHVIIQKNAVPDSNTQAFTFNNNFGNGNPGSFDLTDTTAAGLPSYDAEVLPGKYAVSESAVSGWQLDGTSCDQGETVEDIDVAAGETVTCTFTNEKLATIVLVKNTVGGNDTFDFDATGTGLPSDIDLTTVAGTASQTFTDLNPDNTYTLAENTPAGWNLVSSSCDNGDPLNNITPNAGEVITCTFTNGKKPTLQVLKVVVNDNGGTATQDNFVAKIDGIDVPWATPQLENPGTFVVSEGTVAAGYTMTGITGDCASNGNVTLAYGDNKTCTITNNDDAPSLTLVKVVTNNDGGSAVASAWTLTATGPTGFSGAGPSVSNGASFDAGTYDLSESGPIGYSASAWVCVGGTQNDGDTVTLGLGQSSTCTITNDDQAPTLKLVKVVTNNNGGNAVSDDWTLSADAASPNDGRNFSNLGGSGVFETVFANAGYDLSESTVPGYTAGSWSCVGGSLVGSSVTLGLNEDVTCTVTNDDDAPTLTLIKTVVNDDGGNAVVSDFPLFINGNSVTSGAVNTLSANTLYTATETTLTGYTPSVWGGDCAADGTITLNEGDDKTCTITNDDVAPRLTLVKTVVNDNGGTLGVTDFPLFISGTPATSGTAYNQLANVVLTASETSQTGYSPSVWGGDCAANGTITLNEGDNKTCTITNDDISPTLTVIKTLVPSTDTGLFNLQIDATNKATDVGDGGTTGAVDVNAGAHTVGEVAGTSTDLSNYVSVIGGDCAADGTVTLALAENKTCTITNTRKGHIIVDKVTVPSGDTQSFAFTTTGTGYSSFSLTDTDTPNDQQVVAGAYSVSENALTGWDSDGGVCDQGETPASLDVAPGETVTCTFTNTKRASITIVKDAQPNDCQNFAFAMTGQGGFSLDDDSGVADCLDSNQSQSQTFSNLVPGSYTTTETLPNAFWEFGGATCVNTVGGSTYPVSNVTNGVTVELNPGADVTCTFVNNKLGPTRTLGFWQTHTTYTTSVFNSPTNTFSWFTVGNMIVGDGATHQDPINTIEKLFGAFYSSIPKTTTGAKRSNIDKARMQLAQQLVAAKLNCAAFGCAASVQTLITTADSVYATGTVAQILASASALDAYNNSGDTITIGPAGSATPKTSQSLADKVFWNNP